MSTPLISGGRRPEYMVLKLNGNCVLKMDCPVIQKCFCKPRKYDCDLQLDSHNFSSRDLPIVCLHKWSNKKVNYIFPTEFLPCMRFCASPLQYADILPFFFCYLQASFLLPPFIDVIGWMIFQSMRPLLCCQALAGGLPFLLLQLLLQRILVEGWGHSFQSEKTQTIFWKRKKYFSMSIVIYSERFIKKYYVLKTNM